MGTSNDPYRERDLSIREELQALGQACMRTMLTHPNLKKATKEVEQHAGLDFDRAYGSEMESLKLEGAALDERVSRCAEALRETQKQQRNTKGHLKVADITTGTGGQDSSYWKWTLKDQIVFPLTILLMTLVLGAGSANVFSAIMMGGEPVFLENPTLAVMLSFLLPAGSAAIHVLGDLLERDRSRHRYTLVLLGMTATTLLAWTFLFAQNFQIGASGIDWDGLGQENDSTASAFTFVQLLAEMLCGSCLFLGATHIHSRYSRDAVATSPEGEYLTREGQARQSAYNALEEQRRGVRGRYMQLQSMRLKHIGEQKSLFVSLRRRYDETNPIQSSVERSRVMRVLRSWVLPILFLLALVSPAQGRDLAIGLSPYQETDAAQRQVKSVLQFLTETLESGESALLFDAYRIHTLGTFTVPNNPAYRHPKAKIQANRQTVAALLAFAKAAKAPQGESEPGVIGAIRLPQALAFLGTNYPSSQESDIMLLGSPIYDDPSEKQFSMRRNYIPGDGHLRKSRATTPYGIKGQDALLAKHRVHLGYPDERWKHGDHHVYHVLRFWTLYIEGQGGKLVTFTGDMTTLFERVKSKAPAPQHTYKAETTDKLEMIQLRPPSVERRATIYERPLSETPVSPQALDRAENVEVGITWECGRCDLDLYGQSDPQATALSYLNTQTPEGEYFRDWTRSPRASNGYETLAFRVPVDLGTMLLAVNFYQGSSPGGVKGELRISLNGKTYAQAFHLPASGGNSGAGRQQTLSLRRAVNEHWLVIDPLAVLGRTKDRAPLASRPGE
ncbi:MAG: hypothetical protein MRJ68_09265 [Nitrospira sp.]|nr:hypothetical protein [Nitrospira sp.]